ncbi:MAG TPA: hypothetical protein VFM58_12305 [Solirubrobacteraceae bacterium]|nr:hypothetical protein [Solirubrobacteraceae bacterium]
MNDRYDPLPGLTEIPAFLLRKLSRRGRRIFGVVAALAAVAVAAGLYVAIPAITDSKQEHAAAERRADRQREAALVARLRAEQRLIDGTGTSARGLDGSAAITARRALVSELSAAVQEDAHRRVRTGELDRSIDRVECERFPRGARGEDPATDLANPVGRYSCLAVTADVPGTEAARASSIGYPYRARVDFRAGTYTFCKISGRPGEGSLRRELRVKVPVACGGDA